MGLPTTANYIVVSSLLAPVIVTLGQESGLIVPLIAVHLFVFYFGIMADVTPPVGLASFAAAAVSGGDPIRTGLWRFFYSLRTAALPFLVYLQHRFAADKRGLGAGHFCLCRGYHCDVDIRGGHPRLFFVKSRFYESVLLLLVAFTLFRPGFWMDMVVSPVEDVAPSELNATADELAPGSELRLRIEGEDDIGNPRSFVAVLPLGKGTRAPNVCSTRGSRPSRTRVK